jgi:hypothetical protein
MELMSVFMYIRELPTFRTDSHSHGHQDAVLDDGEQGEHHGGRPDLDPRADGEQDGGDEGPVHAVGEGDQDQRCGEAVHAGETEPAHEEGEGQPPPTGGEGTGVAAAVGQFEEGPAVEQRGHQDPEEEERARAGDPGDGHGDERQNGVDPGARAAGEVGVVEAGHRPVAVDEGVAERFAAQREGGRENEEDKVDHDVAAQQAPSGVQPAPGRRWEDDVADPGEVAEESVRGNGGILVSRGTRTFLRRCLLPRGGVQWLWSPLKSASAPCSTLVDGPLGP